MPRHSQYGTEERIEQSLAELQACPDLESILAWLDAQAGSQRRRVTKGDIQAVRLRIKELGIAAHP